MAYDGRRIDTPPQHWTDLLGERWKGRIGLEDINTAGSQYGQYYMLREKLGVKFWKELLSVQEPKIY
jgi:ABC-type Fe3+ transport system substrate-binding protein